MIPPRVSGYKILHVVHENSTSVTWKAVQTSVDREVLICSLKPETSELEREGFEMVSRAVAKIGHPGFAQVFTVERSSDGIPFLIQEDVAGKTIADLLADGGRIDSVKTAEIGLSIAGALDAAWKQANLVHRNLKPTDIYLLPGGGVKIARFSSATIIRTGQNPFIYDEGMVVGTPNYMAPEQASADDSLDFHADMYGLGALLYHLVTGVKPFATEEDPTDVMQLQLSGYLPPPTKASCEIKPAIEAVITRLMMKRPSDRYEWWQDAIIDLQRAEQGKPVSAPSRDRESTVKAIPLGSARREVKYPVPSSIPEPTRRDCIQRPSIPPTTYVTPPKIIPPRQTGGMFPPAPTAPKFIPPRPAAPPAAPILPQVPVFKNSPEDPENANIARMPIRRSFHDITSKAMAVTGRFFRKPDSPAAAEMNPPAAAPVQADSPPKDANRVKIPKPSSGQSIAAKYFPKLPPAPLRAALWLILLGAMAYTAKMRWEEPAEQEASAADIPVAVETAPAETQPAVPEQQTFQADVPLYAPAKTDPPQTPVAQKTKEPPRVDYNAPAKPADAVSAAPAGVVSAPVQQPAKIHGIPSALINGVASSLAKENLSGARSLLRSAEGVDSEGAEICAAALKTLESCDNVNDQLASFIIDNNRGKAISFSYRGRKIKVVPQAYAAGMLLVKLPPNAAGESKQISVKMADIPAADRLTLSKTADGLRPDRATEVASAVLACAANDAEALRKAAIRIPELKMFFKKDAQ